MKRFLISAALFFLSAGAASADYIYIKININQLSFFPSLGGAVGNFGAAGAGGAAGIGGAIGQPPLPGVGGGIGQPPFPGGIGGGPAIPGGFGGFPGGPPPGGPGMPPPGGYLGGAGMPPPSGGALLGQPPGTVGGAVGMMPQDPNAKWVTAFVEIKNRSAKPMQTPYGLLFTYDHHWGKKNWMVMSPMFPVFGGYIPHETFAKEFDAKFKAEKRDKDKSVKNLLHLARWALSRGQMNEFHKVMEETEKADAKHPVIKNYARVKKQLEKPFKDEDPAQRELMEELRSAGYKAFDSKRNHYRIYAQINASDTTTAASVKRRLDMMEDTLDSFYYWFALQEESGSRQGDSARQPNLPKYRLSAILTASKEEFTTRHLQWGQVPMAADGFTPRRDNVVVMSSKSRLADPIYAEYRALLDNKIQEANVKLQQMGIKLTITQEDLLSGKISQSAEAGKAAVFIGVAQTAVLLAKVLEDDAERHTVTSETVRQLLIASEMFPRNVQIPDWMVEGLASFFETPSGALYPTVGAPSWTHLVSFKHFNKNGKFAVPSKVLGNVVTDSYFLEARQLSKEAQDRRDNDEAQWKAKEAWELARCTSWAFIYYLAQDRKLHYLFKYGEELDQLPRDMDLNDLVLQGSFAKAFDMTDARSARQIDEIKMKNMASYWFEMIQGANLEMMVVQDHYAKERARLDPASTRPVVGTVPGVGPGGFPNPMPPIGPNPMPPIGPNPMPPVQGPASLNDTEWKGLESTGANLTFKFGQGDNIVVSNISGANIGKFQRNGNSVRVQYRGGKGDVVYTGTINGNRMDGVVTSGTDSWKWNAAYGEVGQASDAKRLDGTVWEGKEVEGKIRFVFGDSGKVTMESSKAGRAEGTWILTDVFGKPSPANEQRVGAFSMKISFPGVGTIQGSGGLVSKEFSGTISTSAGASWTFFTKLAGAGSPMPNPTPPIGPMPNPMPPSPQPILPGGGPNPMAPMPNPMPQPLLPGGRAPQPNPVLPGGVPN